jgi:CheY-like chemotaxis protein
VEDEALVRELAVETIRSEGFNVVEEADGTAAMDLLKSAIHIDMLITDVKLPGVNGFQLAEYAHASRPGIPILVVTGFTSDPVPEWVASAGIKVLYKPYDLDTLAREARRLLRDTAA